MTAKQVTWKNTYYYAIRVVKEDTVRPETAQSHSVTYIAIHPHLFVACWVHFRLECMTKYLFQIEQWEYDMLDAVGVPHAKVSDAIDPLRHVRE